MGHRRCCLIIPVGFRAQGGSGQCPEFLLTLSVTSDDLSWLFGRLINSAAAEGKTGPASRLKMALWRLSAREKVLNSTRIRLKQAPVRRASQRLVDFRSRRAEMRTGMVLSGRFQGHLGPEARLISAAGAAESPYRRFLGLPARGTAVCPLAPE